MDSSAKRIPEPDWKRIVFKSISEYGSIWVSTFPAPKMCWEKKELIKPAAEDRSEFKVGDLYAVKGGYGDCWYRGRVTRSTVDEVEVFLVDNGVHRWVDKRDLLLLSDYLKKIQPQIFQVNFHGIQPLQPSYDGDRQQFIKVPSHVWTRAAIDLIQKKLESSKIIYFKAIESGNIKTFDDNKTVKFGSIFVEYINEIVCLNDILCAEGFATRVESFHGIVKLLTKHLTKTRIYKSPLKEETHHKQYDNECFSYMFPYSCMKFGNKNSVSEDKQSPSTAVASSDEGGRSSTNGTCSSQRHVTDSGSEVPCSDLESEFERYEMIQRKREERKNNYSLFSILLHCSPDIEEQIKPVSSLIDTYVCERIQRVLTDRRRADLTPLQKHVYPVLFKRHNIVIVANTTSGKTLTSVVAVSSLLRQDEFYASLKQDYGPKAIHLCAYSYKVRNATKMYKELINGNDVVVKMACGGAGVDSVKFDLLRGCDVLVTTPACLVRMLNAVHIVNLNRLCHIVYDDVDVLFDIFLKEIKILSASIKALEESRNTYKVQKIVLSQTWFPKLRDFVKNVISSGFICVSNFNQLEAVIYSNLKPHFAFLQPANKPDYIYNLLKSHQSPARIVVVCNNQDEVSDLMKKLDSVGKQILVAHEGMTPYEVAYVKKNWIETMTALSPVMITTDSSNSILSELEITDCTWLIHYSLPFSKTIFSNRFGCLLDSFSNIFLKEVKEKPMINVFVDETNDEQFPEIVAIMKRMKIHVVPAIDSAVKKISKKKEKAKKHAPVCDQLREFGACYDRKACNSRHVFIKSVDDAGGALVPQSGFVKLRVLNVHSVNHYSAIIQEFKMDSQWRKMPNIGQLELISLKMSLYYSQSSNVFLFPNAALGDLVAVQPESGLYCRAKVINILEKDAKKAPKKVRVKLIDLGKFMELSVLKLYELPEDLKAFEGQAIDVFLCSIKPADHDCAWDLDAVAYVQRWIDNVQKTIRVRGKNNYLYGQINMSAGYTLWMDHITHCEWLEGTKTEVHTSLGYELLQKKIVLPNPDHMKMIKKLCAEAKLDIHINEIKREKCSKKESIEQWAHLPRDEFSSVEVILAQKPDLIFARHVKFKDRLDLLTNDISELKLSKLKEGDLDVGDFCLAYFEDDGTWNRAKVMEFKSATEVKLFFVDHGDLKTVGWKDLAKIPDTIITRLPFQAMECRLAGVAAPNGKWCEAIDEAIYELTEYEEMNCKTLQAHVLDLELKATVTGGRRYSVVLIDTSVDPFVVINRELVDRGLAECNLDDDTVFDNIVSQCRPIAESGDEESEEDFLDGPSSHGSVDINCNEERVESSNNGQQQQQQQTEQHIVAAKSQQTWSDVRWDGNNIVPVEEPEPITGPFQTILENYEQYEDDLLSLFGLNKNTLLKALLPPEEYEKVDSPKIKEIKNTSDVDGDVSDIEDDCGSKTKIKVKHRLKKRDSEGESRNDCGDDDDDDDRCPPLMRNSDSFEPRVTWFDDRQYVWIYIHLANVESYIVDWTDRTLSFRTKNEEKFYSLDFTFFGLVDPAKLEHSAKGFYVLIKMEKFVSDKLWPRLMITDGSINWIKKHVDHIETSDQDELHDAVIKEKITAKQAFNDLKGFIIDPKPSGFYSDSEFSSDAYEPPADGGDAENPLAPLCS